MRRGRHELYTSNDGAELHGTSITQWSSRLTGGIERAQYDDDVAAGLLVGASRR